MKAFLVVNAVLLGLWIAAMLLIWRLIYILLEREMSLASVTLIAVCCVLGWAIGATVVMLRNR